MTYGEYNFAYKNCKYAKWKASWQKTATQLERPNNTNNLLLLRK